VTGAHAAAADDASSAPATVAPSPERWRVRGQVLALSRPLVMGILNVTPDSFSDGGRYYDAGAALARAERLVEEGADLLDVGGESTRPGAAAVDAAEDRARAVPLIRRLYERLGNAVPISVDTRKAEVARAALEAGAAIVHDVSALADPAMAGVVQGAGAGVVLMHMRGTPETMQALARYGDVVGEVSAELDTAYRAALARGIAAEQIVLDPGIGFAKTGEHNLALLASLDALTARLDRPLLLGPSRKAFLGELLGGVPPEERAVGTAAACVAGVLGGARIVRVHDVHAVRQAVDVAEAIRRAAPPPPRQP
jgi:dihydropteroate synthase